ncbi:hypothetical protein KR51_00007570 [Rubidibacter lacunae KORDI 51-2]|uniref:YrhK domain-containing protein n=1 Tax=Rubidibacter lacunae KORDI 51-2 TaxID=582515 RepID=U5DRY9_9CHRO|nr:hypothetical protein KR51_00007570 [Rubidibacter lacunae KORDI 51-2]
MSDRYYRLGSWLFSFGSVLLTIDAGIAIASSPGPRAWLYFIGSIAFAIGSLLFVLAPQSTQVRAGKRQRSAFEERDRLGF